MSETPMQKLRKILDHVGLHKFGVTVSEGGFTRGLDITLRRTLGYHELSKLDDTIQGVTRDLLADIASSEFAKNLNKDSQA